MQVCNVKKFINWDRDENYKFCCHQSLDCYEQKKIYFPLCYDISAAKKSYKNILLICGAVLGGLIALFSLFFAFLVLFRNFKYFKVYLRAK